MADSFEHKVEDTYTAHQFHDKYQSNCSTCYKENRLLESKRIVDRSSFNKYANDEAFGHSGQIDDPSWSNNPLE